MAVGMAAFGILATVLLGGSWRERSLGLIVVVVAPLALGAYEVVNLAFLHS